MVAVVGTAQADGFLDGSDSAQAPRFGLTLRDARRRTEVRTDAQPMSQRSDPGLATRQTRRPTSEHASAVTDVKSTSKTRLAPPPTENKAAQANAVNAIEHKLGSDGVFSRLSHDDVAAIAGQLSQLNGPDAGKVIDKPQQDGQLDQFAAKVTFPGSLLSSAGLSQDEQRSFLNNMACKLDGAHLVTLQHAYAQSGDAHSQDVAYAVASHASPEAKVQFVHDAAVNGAAQKPDYQGQFGRLTAVYANPDSKAAATVLASTRGGCTAEAFNSLTSQQRQADRRRRRQEHHLQRRGRAGSDPGLGEGQGLRRPDGRHRQPRRA
jgi:hypothetical protein